MVCLLAAPWVQLSVSVGSGWPHNALRHNWHMPISCHFRDCKALLVTSLTHVSGAIASVQIFFFLPLYNYRNWLTVVSGPCSKSLPRSLQKFLIDWLTNSKLDISHVTMGKVTSMLSLICCSSNIVYRYSSIAAELCIVMFMDAVCAFLSVNVINVSLQIWRYWNWRTIRSTLCLTISELYVIFSVFMCGITSLPTFHYLTAVQLWRYLSSSSLILLYCGMAWVDIWCSLSRLLLCDQIHLRADHICDPWLDKLKNSLTSVSLLLTLVTEVYF